MRIVIREIVPLLTILTLLDIVSNASSSNYCKSVLYNGIPWYPLDVCLAANDEYGPYGVKWECATNNIDIIKTKYIDTNCNQDTFSTRTFIMPDPSSANASFSAKCDTNLICDYGLGRNYGSSDCKQISTNFTNMAIITNNCWDYNDLIYSGVTNMTDTPQSLQITCDSYGFAIRLYSDSGCNAANLSGVEHMFGPQSRGQCSYPDPLYPYMNSFQFLSCYAEDSNLIDYVCNSASASIEYKTMGKIHCGDTLTGYLNNSCNVHDYEFIVDHTSYINITASTCGSQTNFDTVLLFLDATFTVVDECDDYHDFYRGSSACDYCPDAYKYNDVTLQYSYLYSGSYYISITGSGLFDYGAYNISLQCAYDSACDWFTGDLIVLKEGRILNSGIGVNPMTFAIDLDIELHALCVSVLCNVIDIRDTFDVEVLKLSINGSNHLWIVQMGTTIHQIENITVSLGVGTSHNVRVWLLATSLFFVFDHVHVATLDVPYFATEDPYIIYASNPWDAALNATATNICINVTASDASSTTQFPTAFTTTEVTEYICDHDYMVEDPIDLNRSVLNWHFDEVEAKEKIEIEFDIKKRSNCSDLACNILHFGDSYDVGIPSLSINGSTQYFMISITTNDPQSENVFQIEDTRAILRNDNLWHKIRLILTNNDLLFEFDDYTFYINSSSYMFYRSDYLFTVYPLYTSSPWMTSLNATILYLCVNSISMPHVFDIVNSSNYYFVTQPMQWTDAELFCEVKYGTSLAIMAHDIQIREAWSLRQDLGRNINETNAWIGINDLQMDGNWSWFGSNLSCDSNNCIHDEHNDGYCGYLTGGYLNINASFDTDECNVYNPFFCDRFNKYASFSDIITERSASVCKYYHENETSAYTELFSNITFAKQLMISFDLKIDSHTWDILQLSESRFWIHHFELWFKSESNELCFSMASEYLCVDNITLDDWKYHRIDLLFFESYQVLFVDDQLYLWHWSYFNKMNLPHSYFGMALNFGDRYYEFNGRIKNICVNSDDVVLPRIFCEDYLIGNSSDDAWYELIVDDPMLVDFDFCGLNSSNALEVIIYSEDMQYVCSCYGGCSWSSWIYQGTEDMEYLPSVLTEGHYLLQIDAWGSDEYEVYFFCDSSFREYGCNDTIFEHIDSDENFHSYKITVNNDTDILRIRSCYGSWSMYVMYTNFSIIDSIESDQDTDCEYIYITTITNITQYLIGISLSESWNNYTINVECDSMDYTTIHNWRDIECGKATINISDYSLEFDSITVRDNYQIGWIKMMTCAEGTDSDFILNEAYNMTDIQYLLPYIISVKISPVGDIWTNEAYDDFAVETIPCSDVIYSINHKKEMSVTLHALNLTIKDVNNDSYWIASDAAKQRLSDGSHCYPFINPNDFARDFTIIYDNCDDGIQLNINTGTCLWNQGQNGANLQGQDVEIYFGFDAIHTQKCNYEFDAVEVIYLESYIMVQHELNAYDALLFCQQNFGASLATIYEGEHIPDEIQAASIMWIGTFISEYGEFCDCSWYGCNNALNATCDITSSEFECITFMNSEIDTAKCSENLIFLCDIDDNDDNSDINDDDGNMDDCSCVNESVSVINMVVSASNIISFEIKLDDSMKGVNILHITDFVSIYIKDDDIAVHIYNVDANNIANEPDIIIDGRKLLCDDEYHLITIEFGMDLRKYTIDRKMYFIEKTMYNFIPYLYQTLPLNMSNDSNIILRNICVCAMDDIIEQKWSYLTDNVYNFLEKYPLNSVGFSAVGFWNEKLFFVTGSVIYYQEINTTDIIKHQTKMNHTILSRQNIDNDDVDEIISWYSQKSIQKDNILYLYDNGAIQAYDLDTISFISKTIVSTTAYNDFSSEYSFSHFICITADDLYLYLIAKGILKYDLTNHTFSASLVTSADFNLLGTACASIATDDKIYIFGGIPSTKKNALNDFPATYTNFWDGFESALYAAQDTVYEYSTYNDSIRLLSGVSLASPSIFLKAISDGAYGIYLYGGYDYITASDDGFEQQIRGVFDAELLTFLPITTNIDHFVTAHLGGDGGLLTSRFLFSCMTYDAISNMFVGYIYPEIIYFMLPSVRVITFNVTDICWRSHIAVDYISHRGMFAFSLRYQQDIQYTIMLNVDFDDQDCYICTEETWSANCTNKCYFALTDDESEGIDIDLAMIKPQMDIFGATSFYIQFYQCFIDYEIQNSLNNYITVTAIPEDIVLCDSNPDTNTSGYVAHLHNDRIGINHNIIVYIDDENMAYCTICNVNNTNCALCEQENTTKILVTDDVENKDWFILQLDAITSDLVIEMNVFNLSYHSKRARNKYESPLSDIAIALISILSFLFVAAIICGAIYLWKRSERFKKEELKRQQQFTVHICNPFVLLISISSYGASDEKRNDDEVNMDITNIRKWCKTYNYKIYPKKRKLKWTQEEIKLALQHCAERVVNQNSNYDCILVIISCNGYNNNIITSDNRLMNKTAIHRVLSSNYPEIRDLPRIFLYDVCEMNAKDHNLDESRQSFGLKDAQFINKKVNDWALNAKNPDYKLVTIDSASNDILIPKGNAMDGSYFIYAFVKSMMANKDEFIGSMMERIQTLHRNNNRSQILHVFYGHTMYLKFRKNKSEQENIKEYNDDYIEMQPLQQSVGTNNNVQTAAILETN